MHGIQTVNLGNLDHEIWDGATKITEMANTVETHGCSGRMWDPGPTSTSQCWFKDDQSPRDCQMHNASAFIGLVMVGTTHAGHTVHG